MSDVKEKAKFDSKFTMLNYLQDTYDRNFIFSAIEQLKKEDEMLQFFDEYCQWMKENGETPEIKKDYVKVAGDNIGYVLGYYDQKMQKKWFDALKSVQHPIFGRNYDVKPEEAFQAGVTWGKKAKKEREKKTLFSKLSSFLPKIK